LATDGQRIHFERERAGLGCACYSRQLVVYEFHAQDSPFRDDVLLAPPPNYSLFHVDRDPDGHARDYRLDLRRLASFANPSIYRGGIAVAHARSLVVDRLSGRINRRELRVAR